MPAEKNKLLRLVVPIVVVAGGLAFVLAGFRNSATQPGSKSAPPMPMPVQAPAPVFPVSSQTAGTTEQSPGPSGPDRAATPEPSAPPQPSAADAAMSAGPMGLRARVQATGAPAPALIGDVAPGGAYKSQITFTLIGAGVESITMADYFERIDKKDHYQVQQRVGIPGASGGIEYLTSLAARALVVDGQLVDLYGTDDEPLWRETGPGHFAAEVIDENEQPVLRLTRAYSLRQGSFVIDVDQRIENLSGRELSIEWVQYGPLELHEDTSGYKIEVRRVRTGFLLDQQRDPSRQLVQADTTLASRTDVVTRVVTNGDAQVWPRPADYKNAGEVVWLAQTSRYFTFAILPRVDDKAAAANIADPTAHPLDKSFKLADEVYAVVRGPAGAADADLRLLLQMTSRTMTVAPGGAAELPFSAYAGPLGRRELASTSEPVFQALGVSDLVIYNIGGPCAWCTFQWLARLLLGFLSFLHDNIVFDWAVAIMILVVCVRTILHPLTRRSQISMARFGRQMQGLAPKQAKLREKYKNEPKKMQEEMVKLMKEEKVNYAGMLGCLPMFLQSPIWFALYAMLYFSFDLRHAPAFYGLFQKISGGNWTFLADLSVADHFLYFGRTVFSVPLLGDVTGLNVLPLLLGVVFFIQQKYLTPPPTAAMTPEQQTQQKMMKVMTVVMFPVLMYNAPSGLAIYFITNSTLGILESRWVRSHINELDKQGTLQGRKPSPWMKKIENMAKEQQAKRKGMKKK